MVLKFFRNLVFISFFFGLSSELFFAAEQKKVPSPTKRISNGLCWVVRQWQGWIAIVMLVVAICFYKKNAEFEKKVVEQQKQAKYLFAATSGSYIIDVLNNNTLVLQEFVYYKGALRYLLKDTYCLGASVVEKELIVCYNAQFNESGLCLQVDDPGSSPQFDGDEGKPPRFSLVRIPAPAAR